MRVREAVVGALLLLLFSSLSGCAAHRAASAKKHLEQQLNPLVGKGENDVVMALGAPNAREEIGDFTVWHFYQSYGSRSSAAIAPNPYVTTGRAATWEAYDRYDLYFRDGILVKWSGYVQR